MKRKIKMQFQGKQYTFEVYYECPSYIFCECPEYPSARGFFTSGYVQANQSLS